MKYDVTSPDSIVAYAEKLPGHSLEELVDFAEIAENLKNKGSLGTLVENYFFEIHPGNEQTPDFKAAGIELKTTGIVKKKDGSYKAKERLVLTMIDYIALANETWDNNSLMKKCKQMLILFYIYDGSLPVIQRKFALRPLLWDFPEDDLEIIKQDWQTIVDKIKAGKAHEISEGDTFYLAACRKGSGGKNETLRKQPFSNEPAKSRAFSLKPSYVNKMIEAAGTGGVKAKTAAKVAEKPLAQAPQKPQATLFTPEYRASAGFDAVIREKLRKFVGKTIDEIARAVDYPNQNNNKSYRRNLAIRMLGGTGKQLPELVKADIELKVITVNDDFKPKEDISFPYFAYVDIANQEWEDSDFFDKLERKFLFVIFRENQDGELVFAGATFWNMPYADKLEAKRVWEETKKRIKEGHAEDLPKKSESHVAHVRPHAKDASDTIATPQGDFLIKKCFWLNSGYIQAQLKKQLGK